MDTKTVSQYPELKQLVENFLLSDSDSQQIIIRSTLRKPMREFKILYPDL